MRLTPLSATLLLPSLATACLHLTGSAFGGPAIALTLTDNGQQTCSGSGGSSKTLNCNSGYWAWYYSDGDVTHALQIQYNTPHGNFKFDLPVQCNNIKGGTVCSYDAYIYC
jgi:hypothetical protein